MKKMSAAGLVALMLFAIAAARSFNPNMSKEEFMQWQESSRAFLSDALYNGAPPKAVPLELSWGEKQTREGYELTSLKFHDRPGHVTTGFLSRPLKPQAQKLPALIALHGHGGTAISCFDPKTLFYYGDYFVKKGYIVLAIDIDHKSLSGVGPFISFERLPKHVKFPQMGQRVWMVKRALDFLETDPQVDAGKIGVVGLSNGGVTTMFAAAMDPRIKMAVASGSLIMSDRMWHTDLVHCRCQYIYKLDGALDYYDIFALVAPRPLMVQSGEKDPIFPIDSAKEAFTYIQKAYAVDGAKDWAVMDIHQGPHEFYAEAPAAFIEKYLPIGK
jgi:dienelactone hydrolase